MNIANYYEPWEHFRTDKSNSAPIHDDGLTVGLEFELASSHDDVGLYNMVEDGLLQTSDSGVAPIQLEYEAQPNVEYELVFNGDYLDCIKERLLWLDEYGVLENVSQHREASAHVHISRAFIEDDLGLDELDFYKATEWLAPFIFRISGRNDYTWNEWTPSRFDYRRSLSDRASLIDEVEPKSYRGCGGSSARYDLTNLANDATIEVRGFSGFYKDTALVAEYLDVVAELIPNIALAMQGRDYKTQYWRACEELNRFLDSHDYLEHLFDLSAYRYDSEAIRAQLRDDAFTRAIKTREDVLDLLRHASYYADEDVVRSARYILDALQRDDDLDLDKLPLTEEGVLKAVRALKDQEARLFKNRVWSA